MKTTPGNRDLGCRSSGGAPNQIPTTSSPGPRLSTAGVLRLGPTSADTNTGRVTEPGDAAGSSTAVSSEVKVRARRARRVHTRRGTHTHPRTARSLTPPPDLRKRDHSITRDRPLGPLLRTHPSASTTPRGPAAQGRSGVCRGLRPAVSRAWRASSRRHLAPPPILIASLKSPPGVFPEQNVQIKPRRPLRVASHRQESACKPLPAHPVP